MTLQSWYAGPLFGMAKGEIEYDAEMARTYAEHLDAMANVEGGAMWPQGTDNGAYEGKTRALPEIWTTYPEVAKKGEALSEAAAALAAVAGDGARCAALEDRSGSARRARAVTTTSAPSRSRRCRQCGPGPSMRWAARLRQPAGRPDARSSARRPVHAAWPPGHAGGGARYLLAVASGSMVGRPGSPIAVTTRRKGVDRGRDVAAAGFDER